MLRKLKTFLQLAGRADFHAIGRQWRFNQRSRAIARRTTPFVYLYGPDRMVCDPELHDSRGAYVEPETDICERRILRAWLEPGDTVLDAGANVGLFTSTAAACVGGGGKVVALEPTPVLVQHLELSARLLRHTCVEILPVALGAQRGEAQFAFSAAGQTTVSQSLQAKELPAGTAELRVVQVTTLNELAGKSGVSEPSAIKLDIEGAETDALGQAPAQWFTSDGPLWIVECHPDALARFGTTVEAVLDRFPPGAFDLWMIGKFAGPHGSDLPPVRLDRAGLASASFHNLIAVPKGERWARRRKRIVSCFSNTGA